MELIPPSQNTMPEGDFTERTDRIRLYLMILRYPLSAHISMTTEETSYLGEIALSSLLDFMSYLYFFIAVRQLRNLKLFKTRICDQTEE